MMKNGELLKSRAARRTVIWSMDLFINAGSLVFISHEITSGVVHSGLHTTGLKGPLQGTRDLRAKHCDGIDWYESRSAEYSTP